VFPTLFLILVRTPLSGYDLHPDGSVARPAGLPDLVFLPRDFPASGELCSTVIVPPSFGSFPIPLP